jgi:hypothetical protein
MPIAMAQRPGLSSSVMTSFDPPFAGLALDRRRALFKHIRQCGLPPPDHADRGSRAEPTAWLACRRPWRGTEAPDEQVLQAATQADRLLFTLDRGFGGLSPPHITLWGGRSQVAGPACGKRRAGCCEITHRLPAGAACPLFGSRSTSITCAFVTPLPLGKTLHSLAGRAEEDNSCDSTDFMTTVTAHEPRSRT